MSPPYERPIFSLSVDTLSKFTPIPLRRTDGLGNMTWFAPEEEDFVVTNFCDRDGEINAPLIRQQLAATYGHFVEVGSSLFEEVRLPLLVALTSLRCM